MKSTSSRSVRGIPKMVSTEDTSGTPPIVEHSASTFIGFTIWTVTLTSGEQYIVKLPGDGRISYGRSLHRDGAEVRFYRDQTTKTYDAVIPSVSMVVSGLVSITKPPLTAEDIGRAEAEAKREAEMAKEAIERMAEAIVRRDFEDKPEEESSW